MSLPSPAIPPHPLWHLCLHGAAAWRRTGGLPQPLERKHAALLAWLWLEGPTARSRLAGLLWPEVSEERARGNLRQRLLKLRQEAGDLVIDTAGLLSLAPGVAVQPPDPPGSLLLQALDFDDCEALARWLEGRRDSERDRRKREWLAEVREAAVSQRLDDALYAADQLLQTDRESEEAYRVLMEVYYLRGDHAAALSAWDRCRDMLRQLYGVQPSAATRLLGDTILGAAQSDQQAQAGAWAPTPGATQPLPATVLRPPRLVGRSAALRAVMDGWQTGQALCVAGVSGVGKSRLLADWAAAIGPTALATARPGDAVLPYASISRLLMAAIERFGPPLDTADARQAGRLLPRLAALTGQAADPVRSDFERTQCLLALGRLLADCARRGCLAFVLDDLQFADPASVAALRVLAEPRPPGPDIGDAALRFAFGLRPEEAGAEASTLLASLQATGHFRQVDLAPLSATDAADLLSSLGVVALATGPSATQIWQQVGGNPAFMLEAVKLLLTRGEPPGGPASPLPLPASIEAVIQRRLELLTPRARHLAQLAAIAGAGYSIPLAAAALACAPIELAEPLRELERCQVFQGRHFVHDVIATVTQRSVPGMVAEFMHRFVAEHLDGHGGDAAHIASHWQACGEWRRAGLAWVQAALAAQAAALANEHAALLDAAIAAFEHDPASHDALFDALAQRVNVFESQGHEGLRPQLITRLQALARTEPQRLSALNHHFGWLTNLGQPVDEAQALAAIDRARAVGRPDLAFEFSRMLGWQWAMNNRADEGQALLLHNEAWIEAEGNLTERAEYRLARSSIFAYGDRLPEAIAEVSQALGAFTEGQDWPNALPAMSNLGVMHYWRGEYPQAHAVLSQARALRQRLYGGSGSGIKIDIHLGAVLYELGQADEAADLLQGALAEMHTWPDNEYRRTECLLAHNHLAQMWIALGQADAAASALAHDATGVAERFYGRRLTLRLRWQRVFAPASLHAAPNRALHDELQAVAGRVASPFNSALMRLELARHAGPADTLAICLPLHDSAVAVQRPGLQLHAATLMAQAALRTGDQARARQWAVAARALQARCAPFDMPAQEVATMLAAVAAMASSSAH